MELCFDLEKARGYKSPSQIARVLTQDWASDNLYCVSCDENRLKSAPEGTKVFDFVCGNCSETYQLKSRRLPLADKVLDAAYQPMIEAVIRNEAPNLFLLHYNSSHYCAENLLIVPRFFISSSCIEPRKPLSDKARRSGWIGCNIVLRHLPVDARIPVIRERKVIGRKTVRDNYGRFRFLMDRKAEARGWTADVLKAVREIGKKDFCLEDVYAFEEYLQRLHPDNRHIRPKIRQQLQFLRDIGVVRFGGRGMYSLI